jgi:site-specific DNA-methyltransferase (adenine-specific)
MEINKVYNAENLEFLKQIPDNFIDLIYCDILYGTGRNFGDYQDLKCDKKIIEGHYLPRLIEMKRVLKDTGSIYLQMDTRINHWLRCLMDDIFGYHNFRNEIVWCYKTIGQGKYFLKKHDVLLFYSKKNPIFCKQKHKPSDNYKKRFGYVADEDGNIPYNKLTPYAQKMYKEENYRNSSPQF